MGQSFLPDPLLQFFHNRVPIVDAESIHQRGAGNKYFPFGGTDHLPADFPEKWFWQVLYLACVEGNGPRKFIH